MTFFAEVGFSSGHGRRNGLQLCLMFFPVDLLQLGGEHVRVDLGKLFGLLLFVLLCEKVIEISHGGRLEVSSLKQEICDIKGSKETFERRLVFKHNLLFISRIMYFDN